MRMPVYKGYEFGPRSELIIKPGLFLVDFSMLIYFFFFSLKNLSIYRCPDCVAVARADCAFIQKTREPKKVRHILCPFT